MFQRCWSKPKKPEEKSVTEFREEEKSVIEFKESDSAELTIRTAQNYQEVSTAIGWAIKEGWSVTEHDAKTYFSAFPKGCRLLFHKKQLIGAIFLANYDNNFVFIGLFIVDKNYRGQGYEKYSGTMR